MDQKQDYIWALMNWTRVPANSMQILVDLLRAPKRSREVRGCELIADVCEANGKMMGLTVMVYQVQIRKRKEKVDPNLVNF